MPVPLDLSSIIQPGPRNESHQRNFATYMVNYTTLSVIPVESQASHPPLNHHHSDPGPSSSHSLPSTPSRSASSDNVLGRVRQPDEAQTLPNFRYSERLWDVNESSEDEGVAPKMPVRTQSESPSESPAPLGGEGAESLHGRPSTEPPKRTPASKSLEQKTRQNSLQTAFELTLSFDRMAISTPDGGDYTPSKPPKNSNRASLSAPTLVTTPPSSVDEARSMFADLGLDESLEETLGFLEVSERSPRTRPRSRGRSLDASGLELTDSELTPSRPARRSSRRLSGEAPEFGLLEGRLRSSASPDISQI